MHRTCDHCGRGLMKSNSRSHSNIATRKWQKINLQTKRINGKIFVLCTRCIRTMNRAKTAA